jgi:hypothetical protein
LEKAGFVGWSVSIMSVASESLAADARRVSIVASEDWLSVLIGLVIFALGLLSLWGADLLGWTVSTSVWIDPGKALSTVSKTYAALGGLSALLATYAALLVALGLAAVALGQDVRRFAVAFTR